MAEEAGEIPDSMLKEIEEEFRHNNFNTQDSAKHKPPPRNSQRGVQGAYNTVKKKKKKKKEEDETVHMEKKKESQQQEEEVIFVDLDPDADSFDQITAKNLQSLLETISRLENSVVKQGGSQAQEVLEDTICEDEEVLFRTPLDRGLRPVPENIKLNKKIGRGNPGTRGTQRAASRGCGCGGVRTAPKSFSDNPFLLSERIHRNIVAAENMLGRRVPVQNLKSHGRGPPNPFTLLTCKEAPNVTKCHGCRDKIDKSQLRFPEDLVFHTKGNCEKFNAHTHEKYFQWDNMYFHAKLKCLRNYSPTFEVREVHCTDEFFTNLDTDRMDHLQRMGLLAQLTGLAKGHLQ